jgi:hypothetical protein
LLDQSASLSSSKLKGPSLEELDCLRSYITGSLSSLRVLKEDTLEKVEITTCRHVGGNFMDLDDFPRLKKLNFRYIAVTGDIQGIGEHDFPTLKYLSLPDTVHGGISYKIRHVPGPGCSSLQRYSKNIMPLSMS